MRRIDRWHESQYSCLTPILTPIQDPHADAHVSFVASSPWSWFRFVKLVQWSA